MLNMSFEYRNKSNEPKNMTKIWDKWIMSLINLEI
jgi:hypothetical protein